MNFANWFHDSIYSKPYLASYSWNYDTLRNNCADVVKKCLKKLGYPIKMSLIPKVTLPKSVYKIALNLDQKMVKKSTMAAGINQPAI
jgi:hypothetical protein